ncbi:hypothetical protein [Burkholderia glumae]|uniref:hypothetical protein n=1 Tax=Burkholderia glumae TaxID=337 RepID=UPI0002E68F99|nr:hypothetical protein [Burkholderia glumae]QHE13640.1 hypothetical protein GQR88_25920 [Burkholderia glumae AU6208]
MDGKVNAHRPAATAPNPGAAADESTGTSQTVAPTRRTSSHALSDLPSTSTVLAREEAPPREAPVIRPSSRERSQTAAPLPTATPSPQHSSAPAPRRLPRATTHAPSAQGPEQAPDPRTINAADEADTESSSSIYFDASSSFGDMDETLRDMDDVSFTNFSNALDRLDDPASAQQLGPVQQDANLSALQQALAIEHRPEPTTAEQRTLTNSVLQLASDIVNNNIDNRAGKLLTSAAHAFVSRALTVYGPTFLRQLVGQGLGEAMSDKHLSKDVKAMIGLLLTAAPIALLVAGMMRDKEKGIATDTSRNSRLALMAVGSVMGLAAIGTGSMAGASASLGAFVLYCAMRDGMQQFVKLGDKHPKEPSFRQSLAAGTAYTVDQMAVGSGMSYASSPSGAGAAGQALQTAHSAERAAWNMGGELADDMISTAITKGGIPELKVSFAIPSLDDFKNTVTGAFPARATLFTASTLLSEIVADKSQHLSKNTQTNVNNLAVALLLGMVMYAPFVQMGKTKSPANRGVSIQELGPNDEIDLEAGPSTLART